MWLGLVIVLAVGLALGWTSLTVYTAWLLTHPPRRGYSYAVSRGLPGDPGELCDGALAFSERRANSSAGASIGVWDVVGRDPAGPVVVLTHGWGDSRVVMLSRLPALAASASRVVLWELPGHGDAQGVCTMGTREVDDLVELVRELGLTRPVLFGYSLGAGVAIAAGAKLGDGVMGVIAEAPYRVPITPARNMLSARSLPHGSTLRGAMAILGVWRGAGISWALGEKSGAGFDRAEHAARLSRQTPMLVIVGEHDEICPVDESREIADAAPLVELRVIAGGTHAALWTDARTSPLAAASVREFMSSLGAPNPQRAAASGSLP